MIKSYIDSYEKEMSKARETAESDVQAAVTALEEISLEVTTDLPNAIYSDGGLHAYRDAVVELIDYLQSRYGGESLNEALLQTMQRTGGFPAIYSVNYQLAEIGKVQEKEGAWLGVSAYVRQAIKHYVASIMEDPHASELEIFYNFDIDEVMLPAIKGAEERHQIEMVMTQALKYGAQVLYIRKCDDGNHVSAMLMHKGKILIYATEKAEEIYKEKMDASAGDGREVIFEQFKTIWL